MKQYLLIVLLFPALTFSKVRVFTTTTNLADLVKVVGGEKVDVESLCKGHQDPHFLEAKPSYTFKLSKADLLVNVGAGLEEGWLPLIIRGSRNPKLRHGQSGSLEASHYVSMLEIPKESELTRSRGDVHPEGNPHFMLSPTRALKVATALTNKLSGIDGVNGPYYQANLKNYSSKLKSKIQEWKIKLKKGLKVITYHKTLTYFYDEFGIQNVDVLEPKPGIPPSAGHVLALIKRIKKENIKFIIVENYFDDSVARRIKKEVSDVKILIVPVAVEGEDGVNSLIDLYEKLIKGLTE